MPMKRRPPRLLLAIACASMPALTAIAAEPIELKPGRKQLFLDDYVVQETTGLARTMHRPTKRGAVLRPDIPSDGSLVQIRSAPMWVPDEKVYKLIYIGYTMEDHATIGPSLAISKDGIHWDKPHLGQMEIRGSKQNNRIVIDPKLRWPLNAFENVIYDPDEPDPARRYKGLLGAQGRQPVVSPDCIHWKRLSNATIPSSDESQLVQDRANKRFLAMVKTGNKHGRAFSISVSTDFERWTPNRFLFGADDEDQPLAKEFIRRRLADPGLAKPLFVDPDPDAGWRPPEGKRIIPTWRAECYNIALFPYEGLYIGLPMMYYPTGQALPERNNTDGFDIIQLVMTRDLVHFKRLGDRQAFISASRVDKGLVGVYDRMQLVPSNQPVERDDELWFYYGGLKWRGYIYEKYTDGRKRDIETLSPEERADFEDGWGAVCLAVLRRDGFISLDSDEKGGSVLTKPIKLAGAKLFLNLDAPKGQAFVEILDEQGKPIPGYSQAEAVAVKGNAVRLPVTWRAKQDVKDLVGKVVRLKIGLKDASLYAFWTE
ncbi:MAG: hypothetical protein JXQ73_13570 [Phycisphaerae bacterium]|nr:hypothetical protein [Phycisphaerae bacterium]